MPQPPQQSKYDDLIDNLAASQKKIDEITQECVYHKLPELGLHAFDEYQSIKQVFTNYKELDEVLDGGLEPGNFYVILGESKAGKSTIVRGLSWAIARGAPVLYLNMEQYARTTFGKIYEQRFGRKFREDIKNNPELTKANCICFKDTAFYVGVWPDRMDFKPFNTRVRPMLLKNIHAIKERENEMPIVVIENLSDMYNERLRGNDSLTNVVTQTVQDIKGFCMENEISCILSHHMAKLLNPKKPTMNDVRDSKRITDLAHSIFIASRQENVNSVNGISTYEYFLTYVAGRGSGQPKRWEIQMDGMELKLV